MALFLVFLILYICTLILLTKRLKKFFPSFYLKEKKQLYMASFSIIFSIIARIFINYIYSIQSVWDALQDSYIKNTWAFPISQMCSVIFASLFPMASIIYSLMYAITHKKRMISKAKKNEGSGGANGKI